MRTARARAVWLAGAAGLLAASLAEARGTGSGKSSATPPATKGSGSGTERALLPPRPPSFEPRPGYLGGMGAAQEPGGPLGPSGDLARPAVVDVTQRPAGDAIRSWSASDVRAARVQQAPDLEWAGA